MQERGEIPNKESSIAKLFSSELDVRLAVTSMHLGGMHAQVNDRAYGPSQAGTLGPDDHEAWRAMEALFQETFKK